MDWVKTTVSMPLFLSIIMITIMVTPCIEDIKTKSSPKKWLIVFILNYLWDSLERIWDPQCTTLFHPKELSDCTELQGNASSPSHTCQCTSWQPLQLHSRGNTLQVSGQVPKSIFTENDIARKLRVFKDKSNEPWLWASNHCTLLEISALTFFLSLFTSLNSFLGLSRTREYRTMCCLAPSLTLFSSFM